MYQAMRAFKRIVGHKDTGDLLLFVQVCEGA